MSTSDKVRLYLLYLPAFVRFSISQLVFTFRSRLHAYSYSPTFSPKNVLILGGSFSGVHLATRLANMLPSGHRVLLVEKNSHFHYSFNFPRYSVLAGHEYKAFVPYSGLSGSAPPGALRVIQGTALNVSDGEVTLASGERVPFAYLAIATGSASPPPAKLVGTSKLDSCAELRAMQTRIRLANRIAIIGGGAVGVQLAGDVKSLYPGKRVVLVHSRTQLLPSFKSDRLHKYVLAALEGMGVEVKLAERPALPRTTQVEAGPIDLEFGDRKHETFDLVIPCTGQQPQSTVLSSFSPSVVSPRTGRILVKPTLQVAEAAHPNVFALGDVAETGGPKMARAGMVQAEVVAANIVRMILERRDSKRYVPESSEGALKLSLGTTDYIWFLGGGRRDILVPGKRKDVDMDPKEIWKHLGVDSGDMTK
ncbi:hypothetical protein BCR39DRAFT_363446 [Naematelia encephala]|uniref:FAD/NAD(P)-binding domain-containing protein n=1 Tax=Naematelia encephala TaxID=71784 RepID=A0A1Y2AKP0_9TREE|nr:hypothetical protein BCR39DRAFT_363446 [Naematelia encephala]